MVPFAGLLAALEQIPDPRRRQGQRYGLAPLLLFAVLAVLAGATSYRRIRLFIGVHRERLNVTFGARFRRAPAQRPVMIDLRKTQIFEWQVSKLRNGLVRRHLAFTYLIEELAKRISVHDRRDEASLIRVPERIARLVEVQETTETELRSTGYFDVL